MGGTLFPPRGRRVVPGASVTLTRTDTDRAEELFREADASGGWRAARVVPLGRPTHRRCASRLTDCVRYVCWSRRTPRVVCLGPCEGIAEMAGAAHIEQWSLSFSFGPVVPARIGESRGLTGCHARRARG